MTNEHADMLAEKIIGTIAGMEESNIEHDDCVLTFLRMILAELKAIRESLERNNR